MEAEAPRRWLRPIKLFIGMLKHAQLAGDASVHPSCSVSGPGRVVLGDGSRIGGGTRVDLRGGRVLMGRACRMLFGAVVNAEGNEVVLGDECVLMHHSIVYGAGGVSIGNRVMIGNHSLIASESHLYRGRESVARQGMRTAPIVIEDDVWIGAYVLVEPGVTIGQGAIVGAHSLVREDVAAYHVVGGVPARVLKTREA